MRSDDALLLDMLLAARKISKFIQGMEQADFFRNEMAQSAVIRELQVIGEAARMISDETKTRYAHLEWSIISGMRNRVIHEYFNIDIGIVWDTVQRDIPYLVTQLERIVPSEPGNDHTR